MLENTNKTNILNINLKVLLQIQIFGLKSYENEIQGVAFSAQSSSSRVYPLGHAEQAGPDL